MSSNESIVYGFHWATQVSSNYKVKKRSDSLCVHFPQGNENIYALTNQQKYYLRIDLTDHANNTRYAFYDQFWIDNESHHYKLHVYDYSGDAGKVPFSCICNVL